MSSYPERALGDVRQIMCIVSFQICTMRHFVTDAFAVHVAIFFRFKAYNAWPALAVQLLLVSSTTHNYKYTYD